MVEEPLPLESAGVITITGVNLDGGISLTYGDGGYSTFSSLMALWSPGDTLTVAASGATIPAFSGHAVVGPGDMTLTAPACTGGNCGTVSRAADLSISWTGATKVTAALVSKGPTKKVTIECPLASSPGSVGAAVIARLGKSDAGYANTLYVYPVAATTFVAGDRTVKFEATAGGAGLFGATSGGVIKTSD